MRIDKVSASSLPERYGINKATNKTGIVTSLPKSGLLTKLTNIQMNGSSLKYQISTRKPPSDTVEPANSSDITPFYLPIRKLANHLNNLSIKPAPIKHSPGETIFRYKKKQLPLSA